MPTAMNNVKYQRAVFFFSFRFEYSARCRLLCCACVFRTYQLEVSLVRSLARYLVSIVPVAIEYSAGTFLLLSVRLSLCSRGVA
jgi:hypothetical protein